MDGADLMTRAPGRFNRLRDQALAWQGSPAAWLQVALPPLARFGAVIASRLLQPRPAVLLTPAAAVPGSANRLGALFPVSHNSDITCVPEIIRAAVTTRPPILKHPAPDRGLRGLGESAVDFALAFRAQGMDDGANRFTSDVLFRIRTACKENRMPYPHRAVELKGAVPA